MATDNRKTSRVSLHHHVMAHPARATAQLAVPMIRLERSRNLTMKRGPAGNVEPLGRASLRSKSSSNSSEDKAKVCKNCCRKVIQFLFTQVGVGAVVVCYTIVGAVIFRIIETQSIDPHPAMVEKCRKDVIVKLWNSTYHYNTLNKALWTRDIGKTLLEHQDYLVVLIKNGYDQKTNEERWTFPAALMFTLSVITMIGYGHMVPRTEWGKIGVMIYACIGIPVYILYFMNMGKVLSKMLKWIYTKAYRWNVRRKWKMSMIHFDGIPIEQEQELDEAYLDALEQKVLVPPTTCLWVMSVYLLIGTILFAEWEGWGYLDSVYFCVTSLLKIGLGDLVPGHHVGSELDAAETLDELKLVINFVYILLGMGVVAMCYYLLKEDVTDKVEQIKTKVSDKCQKCRRNLGL